MVSLLMMLLACRPSGDAPPAKNTTEPPETTFVSTTPEVDIPMALKISNVAVVRSVHWPGGGRELTVRVVDDAGAPVDDPVLAIETDGAADLQMAVTPVSLDPEYLGLVLLPGADQGQVDDALAFLAMRPEEEWTAIYLASEPVLQLSGFTNNPTRLARTLAQIPDLDQPVAEDLDDALSEVADLVEGVGGDGPRGMRAAVVFTDLEDLYPNSDIPLLRVGTGIDLQQASDWIDETAASAHWTVSVCGPRPSSAPT